MEELEVEQPAASKAAESPTKRRSCGIDMDYVKSVNGVVKANQILGSFIAFFISCFAGIWAIFILFSIVLFFGTSVTLCIFLVFAFSCAEKITRINFYLVDLLVSLIGTVAYFLVSTISLTSSGLNVVMIVASVIGFLAMIGFVLNIWFSFKRWRQSRQKPSENN